MRKFILIALAALLLSATPGYAGFIMKKKAVAVAAKADMPKNETINTAAGDVISASAFSVSNPQETVKRQSLLSRIIHPSASKSASIPQWLYIVLAIFPLGWLGMGINDNFEGYDWAISLILYVLGWLPGIIYTLIMMKNYY
jgi:uncharacterized membrane protein YqaE (UPF0057 family)